MSAEAESRKKLQATRGVEDAAAEAADLLKQNSGASPESRLPYTKQDEWDGAITKGLIEDLNVGQFFSQKIYPRAGEGWGNSSLMKIT